MIVHELHCAIFRVKVTVRTPNPVIKILLFLHTVRTADSFAVKLDLVAHHPKLESSMKMLDCCVQG